eukprot:TRINITY_DN5469_c0_g4_i8.p5 TRINITY_DN5469_c0_g4~~TRINITY_DN5469_c0_g4_i8.p5  ORF type:complete len:113 (+),score=1.18 TRINITY_DN5469_c0_g4_i8:417-755(+)
MSSQILLTQNNDYPKLSKKSVERKKAFVDDKRGNQRPTFPKYRKINKARPTPYIWYAFSILLLNNIHTYINIHTILLIKKVLPQNAQMQLQYRLGTILSISLLPFDLQLEQA